MPRKIGLKTKETNKGLGKGLGALLGDTPMPEGATELAISKIKPNPYQPRRFFDEKSLLVLADSLQRYGVVQPVIVRAKKNFYELIAGERRLRAASLAGFTKIPAIIRVYSDTDATEIALVENLQRQDLDIIEEALAYQRLIKEFTLTQEEVGKKVGRSRSYITNVLRLLLFPEEIQDLLSEGVLSIGQVRPLLALKEAAMQLSLARRIVSEDLSARQVEELMGRSKRKKPPVAAAYEAYLTAMADKLKLSLGTPARINYRKKGKSVRGSIEISFNSDEELERLLQLLEDK